MLLKPRLYLWTLPLVLIIVVVCFALVSRANLKAAVSKKVEKIKEHVSVGMDIDEAVRALKAQGVRVGEKYQPSIDKDYWQVEVPVLDKIPLSDTVRYVTGLPPDNTLKAYVVIIANNDGVITSVE